MEFARRGILTLAMAAVGAVVLMFQEEPAARGQAAVKPQVVRTAVAPRHEHGSRERAFPSAATPAEAAPCLLQAAGEAAQRYGRFSRTPAQADARTVQVLRPSP